MKQSRDVSLHNFDGLALSGLVFSVGTGMRYRSPGIIVYFWSNCILTSSLLTVACASCIISCSVICVALSKWLFWSNPACIGYNATHRVTVHQQISTIVHIIITSSSSSTHHALGLASFSTEQFYRAVWMRFQQYLNKLFCVQVLDLFECGSLCKGTRIALREAYFKATCLLHTHDLIPAHCYTVWVRLPDIGSLQPRVVPKRDPGGTSLYVVVSWIV